MALNIPVGLYERMLSHCLAAYPNEACGMLAGSGDAASDLYAMTNTEPSPVSYFMDPKEQFSAMKKMREKGAALIGIFHSHPQSPPYPSTKDVGLAFYADAIYIIVSLMDTENPVVKAYRIAEGNIEEVSLVVC